VAQEDNLGIARRIAVAWEKSGVSVNCELCRHRDWNLVASTGSDSIGFPLWQNGSTQTGEAYLAYAVQCKKCGNVRVMSKARIEELSAREKVS
jgi:ribosomal protein S27E